MTNPYFERPSSVAAGTTIRSDKYNSDLDTHESAFNALHDRLQHAVFLPETFSGNPNIPEQTVNDTFIYIDSTGNMALYPIATILEQFELVEQRYNQINAWQTQVAEDAIEAQDAATLSQRFANEAENIEVVSGLYSAKHWAKHAEAQIPLIEAAGQAKVDAAQVKVDEAQTKVDDAQAQVSLATTQANNAATQATNAANSATKADNFANYAHNQLVPNSGGKYSSYHWAKEAEAYAQQTLDTVNGDFVPSTRTVNGKALNANIILNASDVNALPSTTAITDLNGVPASRQVNGKSLTSNITLDASDVGALPSSTTLAALGGVPVGRTVNGKALSDNITLNASDVGALSNSTTLSTLGGVPTTRTVNGKALSSNITLNASDVSALPNTTTLSTLGGVPTSRQVNGKALTSNITLNHNDVGALPNTEKATKIQRVSGSFTATRLAGVTEYVTTATSNTTCTVNDNAFAADEKLIIHKQVKSGQLNLVAGQTMYTPNGSGASSHFIPAGIACTVELVFTGGHSILRIYN